MPGPWHVTDPAPSFEGMCLPESEEIGTERDMEEDLDVSVNMEDSCLIMVLWNVSMVIDEDSLLCIWLLPP